MTDDEKLRNEIDAKCYWHKWFAWHPVKILHPTTGVTYSVWLETVGRKCKVTTVSDGEYGSKDAVRTIKYCFVEDLLINTLNDNDLIDDRDEW